MSLSLREIGRELRDTAVALAPAVAIILVFQVFVVRLSAGEFGRIALGLVLTLVGFSLFLVGARNGLLPLGEGIGTTFVERRAVLPLLTFGLLLGVVLTIAEPDVRLLALQVEETLGVLESRTVLIIVAAAGLGIFGVFALLRLLLGTPIHYYLIPGYLACLVLTLFVPESGVTMAFDMGAVTTGPMTVPFLMALGAGTASVLAGRDRFTSGFGIMAIGSVGPVLAILLWNVFGGSS